MFSNARPEFYEDQSNKDAGTADGGIGLFTRRVGRKGKFTTDELLDNCRGKPNCCFSTTGDLVDKRRESAWLIPAWKAPEGTSQEEAWDQLSMVLRKYPPGQNGNDYGGFNLAVKKRNYQYIQFQSLRGRINDVEFTILPASDPNDGRVLIGMRSSSRAQINPLSFIREESRDEGSNAKRLNYIASVLREKGWDAPEITRKTHPDYFEANADAFT